MDIKNLQTKYKTDKFDLGYFDHIYQHILPNYFNSAKNVLEIGTYNGDSIILWKDLFLNANIYGADINRCNRIENQERITHIVGDAYTKEFTDQFNDKFFDIIIDDGPHTLSSFIFLIDNYINKLTDGGLLIIEDIINLEWTNILSNRLSKIENITYNIYNMGGKQNTGDLLSKWSSGLDVISIYKK